MKLKPKGFMQASARLAARLLEALSSGELPQNQRRTARWALKYYLAPIDLIPDIFPGIGMLDDYLLLWSVSRGLKPSEQDLPPQHELEQAIRVYLTDN